MLHTEISTKINTKSDVLFTGFCNYVLALYYNQIAVFLIYLD